MSQSATPRKRSLLGTLRTYFLTGLVLTAPFSLTVYLVIMVVEAIDGWFRPLIPPQYDPNQWLPFHVPGLGVVFAIILLTLIGGLAANLLGRALVRITESIIRRLPVVGAIYGGLKQILEAAFREQRAAFTQVVLVEYPRKGMWALAFVTNQLTEGVLVEALPKGTMRKREWITLFLPTTPNPTSGFFLIVPKDDTIVLPIGVEAAAKLIISAGMVNAPQETAQLT